MTRPGGNMAIAIQFGGMTTALSGILGMGMGFANTKRVQKIMERSMRSAGQEFGRIADDDPSVAHVYEYAPPPQMVDQSPGGRLWELQERREAGRIVTRIAFRNAKKPSHPDPELQALAGKPMRLHYFPNKADHLERTEWLVSRAGEQRHTTSTPPGPAKMLFHMWNGRPVFSKVHRRKNEFHKAFRNLFTKYWQTKVTGDMIPKVATASTVALNKVAPKVTGLARAQSIMPIIPANFSGVLALDGRRPYIGARTQPGTVKKFEKLMSQTLEAELKKQWR